MRIRFRSYGLGHVARLQDGKVLMHRLQAAIIHTSFLLSRGTWAPYAMDSLRPPLILVPPSVRSVLPPG